MKVYGITMTTEDSEGDSVFQQMFRTKERAEAALRDFHDDAWGSELPAAPNPKGFYCDEEYGIAYEITEYELED